MHWSIAVLTLVVIFFGWATWLELRAIRRAVERLVRFGLSDGIPRTRLVPEE